MKEVQGSTILPVSHQIFEDKNFCDLNWSGTSFCGKNKGFQEIVKSVYLNVNLGFCLNLKQNWLKNVTNFLKMKSCYSWKSFVGYSHYLQLDSK